MDEQKPSPRKVKFAPKAPPRKKPHSVAPKTEVEEDDGEAAEAELLLRRFNAHDSGKPLRGQGGGQGLVVVVVVVVCEENLGRQGTKVQKKSSVQVAFDQGVVSSTPIRTYGGPKDERSGPSSSTKLRSSDSEKGAFGSQPLAAKEDALVVSTDSTDGIPPKMKEYKEPWDYEHTYYPTSLPLRPPCSGDPEILDEAEFGEAARNVEYDENAINPASELGLLDESEKENMFFFQLPPKLPMVKRSASVKGKARSDSSSSSSSKANSSTGDCNLESLSEGYMGKLLVYKSGKIKLKLGETLYDQKNIDDSSLKMSTDYGFGFGLNMQVSPGSDCIFPQNVAAVNALDRHFCVLGDIEKRAVVTPDLDSLLDTIIDLE
ncbi:hypothetical protein CDL15_Pgr021869 [Punica granatum]|uniref:DNA-directed RNA polymerase III subunit RPC4-like n=1 Tax=Punica granatum TaxID=22663 RepID=A0A218WS68_PUNGR|nr:hypothetical protein CDL15_Pgr021869 [Punica granatum]